MPISCFVIGQGAIALKCLEVLRQAECSILGIYSANGSLQEWAIEQNIAHAETRQTFCNQLHSSNYDYLFSINNGWIIPPAVLVRARRSTINFHDAPLPKYAGLYATSWALLHGETQHAVTWHEVVPEIDAGRIFKQSIVPIELSDTALSLNTRCYEVAIAAFTELVRELIEDRVQPTAQDLTQRSYFGLNDRPTAAGVVNFTEKAQTIANLVRALNFGAMPNPLGCAKLWLPHGVVAVGQAQTLDSALHAGQPSPGQVLTINSEPNSDRAKLSIATSHGAIELSQLTTLDGLPVSQTALIEQYGVQIGVQLPLLSEIDRQAIHDRNLSLCRFERRWIRRLAQLSPFVHPYVQPHKDSTLYRTAIKLDRTIEPRSLLALFAAYCARLASEDEFDLGVQTEAQRSVAPEIFAQIVPMRIAVQAEDSVRNFCERFELALSETEQWQSYALDSGMRYPELRGQRITLAIAIVLAASPSALDVKHLTAQVAFVAYQDGSVPELVHQGALEPKQPQAIVRQLQSLIAASVDDPTQRVTALPLLSREEQQQLIEWNQTKKPYPSDRSVHELIDQQAIATPDAIAVRFGQTELSYQALERRSNQVARWLRFVGVQPETLVALCVPRSVDLIVGLLGILKSGGAYVPIDPTYPRDRIAFLLEDSGVQVIVTVKSLRSLFSPLQTVCLDDAAIAEFESDALSVAVTSDHLAYVIYTSGSTGKPKGVQVPHRAIVNHSWAIAELYQLSPRDCVLQSASISFDVAGEQIYPALFRGGTVVVRPDNLLESFERFIQFVQRRSITVLILPTAFWREWTIDLIESNQSIPDCLRVVAVGTEKVLADQLAQWQQITRDRVTFFQGYGPTEATITCTVYQYLNQDLNPEQAVPIGNPLPNLELYILDRYLQPVPVGVIGEIYIGGDGLARGYHNQPLLTTERFVTHPFRSSAKLYKTGDLARFQPDGQIVYCDRSDDQIKLNGFRIELGEIEAVLREFPIVQQAVVRADASQNKQRLIAYVVPAPQQTLISADLAEFIQQKLPTYMIPAAIVQLETLPLTPNGKIDYRSLPQVEPSNSADRTPSNALEQQLMTLWRSILQVEYLAVTDNFFDIGGHSLLALRLLRRIEQTFQTPISLLDFLQAPTIEQLAVHLQKTRFNPPNSRSSNSEYLVPIQPHGSRPPLFGVHILGKGLSFYRPIATYLGTDQPLYGLAQLHDATERPAPLPSVEALAARYIQSMQTVQPEGPYSLVGISFGGTVAFEMAQQLRSQGHEIALLGMLDTIPPIKTVESLPKSKQATAYWQRLRKMQPAAAIAKLKDRLIGRSLQSEKIEAIYRWFYRVLDRPFPDALQETLYIQQSQRAASQYKPQQYGGKITLFRAKDQTITASAARDPRLGWEELTAAGLQIHDVPGDHLGMLKEPYVQILAQYLKQYMNESSE